MAGEQALHMLAGFAIGGSGDVTIREVAVALDVPSLEVRTNMEKLAFGGLVQERGGDTLAVLPETLREVLVRDYFFNRPGHQNWRDYLVRVRDRGSLCHTLIGASTRGACVSSRDLIELLEAAGDSNGWEAFAWSSSHHARIVMERRPEAVTTLAQPLLVHCPELALPAILGRAIDDERPLHSHPEHGLRLIEHWIETAMPGTGLALSRRRALWMALDEWFRLGRDTRIGLRALHLVVSPKVEIQEQSPSDRLTFKFRKAALKTTETDEISHLWPTILSRLSALRIDSWPAVFEAVDEWVYPERHLVPFSDGQCDTFRATSKVVLENLAHLAGGKPGVLSAIELRCRHLELQLNVSIDEDYRVLFPGDPYKDRESWQARCDEQHRAALRLAAMWAELSPDTVATKLMFCVEEARMVNESSPDYTAFVLQEIASVVPKVLPWIDVLVAKGASASSLLPCLQIAKERAECGWQERALSCLNSSSAAAAIPVLLTGSPLAPDEKELLFLQLRKHLELVAQLCRQRKVSENHLHDLLNDSDERLVAVVAEAMWHDSDSAMIPPSLSQIWRAAVLRSHLSDYSLGRIFKADRSLAIEWLRQQSRGSARYRLSEESIEAACEDLSPKERAEILRSFDAEACAATDIARCVVGNDIELYRTLLNDKGAVALHLAPLRRKPDENWARLAQIALDCGIDKGDVAKTGCWETHFRFAAVPQKYDESASTWSALSCHDDPRIREVAEIGLRDAEAEGRFWRQRDSEEEFREVYG